MGHVGDAAEFARVAAAGLLATGLRCLGLLGPDQPDVVPDLARRGGAGSDGAASTAGRPPDSPRPWRARRGAPAPAPAGGRSRRPPRRRRPPATRVSPTRWPSAVIRAPASDRRWAAAAVSRRRRRPSRRPARAVASRGQSRRGGAGGPPCTSHGDEFVDMDSDIGVDPRLRPRRAGGHRGFRERGRGLRVRRDRAQGQRTCRRRG